MSFDFVNPFMLVGLAGVALPVLSHLLSKKKYDTVDWGAMQFLELSRNAQRKLRLEEILLMLMRMALIALLAFAFARPWLSGSLLAGLGSKQNRDVVIILDGSYSMGWEGKATTPHAAGIQWAHEFLEELQSGDTVSLLDARDNVRPVIERPTLDFSKVREALTELPSPSGTSDLTEAIIKAVHLLNSADNLSREIVIITDRQALGWSPTEQNLWARIDNLLQQPAIKPRLWAIDVSGSTTDRKVNFTVDQLQLSRELSVKDFPIRFKTKISASGTETTVTRKIFFEVDEQRLTEKTLLVQIPPDGEATVEFEHKFDSLGSHLVSVVLEADPLPGDNRSDAAISVTAALPVLLVDGQPNFDPTASETFFTRMALSAPSNFTPWISATVLPADQLQPADFQVPEVVILANVARLSAEVTAALSQFVASGGGVLVAPGDAVDAEFYNSQLFADNTGWLPASFQAIQSSEQNDLGRTQIVSDSLELPWLTRFRRENKGNLTNARFSKWWKLEPAVATAEIPVDEENPSETEEIEPHDLPPATSVARFDTSDPFLILRSFDRGNVAVMAVPLDADWGNMPSKPDYVAYLHEIIFNLAQGKAQRNLNAGEPVSFPVPPELNPDDYLFKGPDETEFEAEVVGDDSEISIRLSDTTLPGIYRFEQKNPAEHNPQLAQIFVVNFDRTESDLTTLTDSDQLLLTQNDRLKFIDTAEDAEQEMLADESKSEIWHLFMLLILAILVFEVVMTRRLVQGGHAVNDDDDDEFPTDHTDNDSPSTENQTRAAAQPQEPAMN